MKILVLGGNRFVGKILAKELQAKGEIITLFNRKGTGPDGCRIIPGDRNKLEDLEKIQFDKYDCIVDMCLYKPEQFKLMEPLLNESIPYIFISSGAAYKNVNIWPVDENYKLGGISTFGNYGKEKADVENLISKSNLENYKILRPSYIVGEGNHNPRLGYYINAIQNNTPIEVAGNGENIINLVFAEDVVECILNIIYSDLDLNLSSPISYNISSNEFMTVNSLINIIAKELKVENLKINYDSSEAIFPYTHYGVFSNDRIKIFYNKEFKTLKESLPSYINWYNKNN